MEIGVQRLSILSAPRPASKGLQIDGFRVIEVVMAFFALLFLLPLFLVIASLVRLDSPGPSLFRQTRLGRNGEVFSCLKFRSMAGDAEVRLEALLARDPVARQEWDVHRKLTADPRITRLGAFLRRSSLDELPQLINVLRGDMSLVGPRPIVVEEVRHYGRRLKAYCCVRPGITGLWQVSGRSDTSYRRRVACDVLYVRRKCLRLDVEIVLATIPAVLLSRGAR